MTISQLQNRLCYSHSIGLSTMEGRGFYYPVDTAIDADGKLYTVSRSLDGDVRGLRVTVYDLESEYFGTFGGHGTGDGQFVWPTAIVRDPEGNTYVADEYTNRIVTFDSDWKATGSWGKTGAEPGEMDGPSGLAFDTEGNLLVVDHRNNRVQRFTRDGIYLSSFGSKGSGDGEFDLPWGITVVSNGDVLVADWGNDRIQRFASDGTFVTSYGTSGRGEGALHRPASVTVDSEGFMYVADWGNERIQIFDSEGNFIQALRGEATDSRWAEDFLRINVEEAQARASADMAKDIDFFVNDPHEVSSHIEKYFWAPTSVKLDSEGRLYVTESNRHRLQIYQRA